MEYFRTKTGKALLVINGYTFHQEHKSGKFLHYWRCTSHSSKCRARVSVTDEGVVVRSHLEHEHHARPNLYIKDGIVHRQKKTDIAAMMAEGFAQQSPASSKDGD